MTRHATPITLALLLALTFLALDSSPRIVRADTWSTQSCQYDYGNPQNAWPGSGYVLYDGALMNGQGCAIWDESGPAEWAVWGDTLLSEQSYWVWAWVNGEDSCSGSVFTSDMTSSGSATNASSAGTGSWAYGPYLNCIDGNTHVYRIYTQHQRQYTSGSSSEGYSSDVNY